MTNNRRIRPLRKPRRTPPARKPARLGHQLLVAQRRRVTPEVRENQVVELRRRGLTFEAIAARLQLDDVDAAHAVFERGLARSLPPTPEQLRRDQLARIRETEEAQWERAELGSLAALEVLADLELERRQLLQGDVPIETKRIVGPVETATAGECARLSDVAPALAATALVLARVVDEHTDEPGATATASRELRMHMSQLRGLAGTRPPQQASGQATDPDDSAAKQTGRVVVPQTELDRLRERARERSGS